jgi:lipooligosaccharide transport system permease protein
VANRNVAALRSGVGYWLALASGFFEPLLYLLSIGVGVGKLVGHMALPDGRLVTYAAFVAPSMLAASSMNGAFAETTFNFFAKMKWMKIYDAMLATPIRPIEIAVGELLWALVRGTTYSVAFLVIMAGMGLTTWAGALLALPMTILVGLAFGGVGMAISTFINSWQDFDVVIVIQMALFLFSATFVPLDSYPDWLGAIVRWTPLYQAVELLRGITTVSWSWHMLVNVGYLVLLGLTGLIIAGRRMGRLLLK